MLTETRGFASVAERNAFYKKAASLILPMALQNLINVGVTATDIILLGKVGETVLSGASLAGQIQFIMTLIFFGVTSGASVLIAQYWGKKDVDAIEKVMGIALKIAVVTGALFTAAALFFPGYLMRIYTAEPAVIAEGVKYLRIVGISYLFNAVSMVYLNLIRSVERVIISTVVYALSLALNFIIDVILIFGYLGFAPMGVKGAAIGTLIARILEFVIMAIYAVWMNDTVKIRLRYCLHMDPVLLGDFFKYALPVTFNEMAWGVAFSMNAAIIGHLGSAAVAANSVAQVVRQLAMVISFGVSSAAAIMVGKAIGEADSASAVLYAEKLQDGQCGVRRGRCRSGTSPPAFRHQSDDIICAGGRLFVSYDWRDGGLSHAAVPQYAGDRGRPAGRRRYPVRTAGGCPEHVVLFHSAWFYRRLCAETGHKNRLYDADER